ncbi:Fatty acyl-CoA reductase [Theobroma cacao]|nr:Fatty acyl-CoA reductase [Theobroma cacao]
MKFYNSIQDFSSPLWREVALLNQFSATTVSNTKLLEIIKSKEHAEYLGTIYMPMSEEEKKKFGCDVKSVDWKDYIVNVHIPGLRRHILKERFI